jgi:hypothetical protein
MAPIVAGTPTEPRIRGAIPHADFTYEQSGQPGQRASKRFTVCRSHLKGLYGGLHFTLALLLLTICVDEVPAPRSRPTTVRQGNGGLYNRETDKQL